MKFSVELRARALLSESIETKHKRFLNALFQIPAPWGIEKEQAPSAPDPGSELVASWNLGKLLRGSAKGHVYYQFRRPFQDEAGHDDFVDLKFDPKKTDFRSFAYMEFPQYVAAFAAYLGTVAHDEFSYLDYDALHAIRYNPRHMVYRVSQVSFFDAALCKNAFKLSPEQVAEKLNGKVEHTRLVSGGVLIIGSSAPLDLMDADRLSREWRQLLNEA